MIKINTIIGFGSAKQGTSKVHGNPLGMEDGKKAKLSYGFDHEDFFVPNEIYDLFNATLGARGQKAYGNYQKTLVSLKENKKTRDEVERFISLTGLDIDKYLPGVYLTLSKSTKSTASLAAKPRFLITQCLICSVILRRLCLMTS